MRTRTTLARTFPIIEAEKNLRKVLRAVDRAGSVRLTKNGKARYHISREEAEGTLLQHLEEGLREHREGRTRVLRSLAEL